MTFEIAYVLALLALASVLFAIDVVGIDVVALILLLALAVPGIIEPEQALAGFGSSTIVVLVALFVLTAGITRTGVVERVGLRLATVRTFSPPALARVILVATTAMSSFLSNTVTTAVFLPLAIGTARRAKLAVRKLLMPLAFASILSGGITLISTSTNLVVSGELPRYGLEGLGFFELAPVGVPMTVLGMLYLLWIAPRLLGDGDGDGVVESYGLRKYFSEVIVTPRSPLAGTTLGESPFASSLELNVVGVRRGETRTLSPRSSMTLKEGDVLLVEGRSEDILACKDAAGVEIRPDFELSDPDLVSEEIRMVEALVLPLSGLIGQTLREAAFAERTGLTVLAIHTPGGSPARTRERLSRRRLRAGDVLLLQGSEAQLQRIDDRDLVLLGDVSAHHPRSAKGKVAAAIFVAALALGATQVIALPLAFLLGVVALLLTRCLTPEEAYESVDWRLMVLIGSMLAFGEAMRVTGTADYLADLIVEHVAPLGSQAVLAGFFLLTVVLTQPMSNQAAALVVLPVAIGTAQRLGYEPRALAMSVTFAASCSFLTPLEPSCALVYGPGRYRFSDFVRVGAGLTVIVFVVSMLLIPLFWPLAPRAG
jgi:di/tricarboxylate transporter